MTDQVENEATCHKMTHHPMTQTRCHMTPRGRASTWDRQVDLQPHYPKDAKKEKSNNTSSFLAKQYAL